MQRLAKTFLIAASAAALAAPAFAFDMPGDFTALDNNADARVEFSEFADYAKTQGVSPTLAAQHFTKMSAGDAVITEDEFFLAAATGSYALNPAPAYNADFDMPVTEVAPASAMVAEPVQPEAVMSDAVEYTPPVEKTDTVTDTETDTTYDVDTETTIENGDIEVTTDISPVDTTESPPEGSLITTKPVEDVAGEVETYDENAPVEAPVEDYGNQDDLFGDLPTEDTMTDEAKDETAADLDFEGDIEGDVDVSVEGDMGTEEDPLD